MNTAWDASPQIVPQGSMRLFDKNLAVTRGSASQRSVGGRCAHCHRAVAWFDRYHMLDDGLQTAQLRCIKELFDGANVTDDAGVTKPIRSATSMFLGDANVVTEQYYDGFLPGNAEQLGDVMYDHVEALPSPAHLRNVHRRGTSRRSRVLQRSTRPAAPVASASPAVRSTEQPPRRRSPRATASTTPSVEASAP